MARPWDVSSADPVRVADESSSHSWTSGSGITSPSTATAILAAPSSEKPVYS